MSITSGVITIFTYVDLHLAMHDFSGQTAPSGQTAWHCTTQISKPKPSVFGTHVCSPIYSEIFVQPPFAPFHFSPGLVICDISIASPVQLQKPTPLWLSRHRTPSEQLHCQLASLSWRSSRRTNHHWPVACLGARNSYIYIWFAQTFLSIKPSYTNTHIADTPLGYFPSTWIEHISFKTSSQQKTMKVHHGENGCHLHVGNGCFFKVAR